ncbi:hypothetical protein AU255_19390 [Methyloprofundus sedimenti]|uniref:NlpC/P60 domain-containing protein n=1 Tax=Methyloprofundus sedimenti TaxID=1420851 RepID=A0A1V8M0Q0_9GAMM|nr:NlpC/P60 family protein [Methyloprofundus sedimenti]OQK15144.1 hypothetical protein AU255_19390 [Methyloprofundus sedimenti]
MTYKTLKIISVTSFILLLAGCANNNVAVKTTKIVATNKVKQVLYAQFSEWKSVKHRLGGLSKDGIDCSGFVYLTYIDNFSIELPRTTEQQVRSGIKIYSQDNLKAGDLVFFKTGIWQRHVGIYLEQKKFMHVSTKKGVSISHLDNSYWRKGIGKRLEF